MPLSRPQTVWIFIIAHTLIWTLVPTGLFPNPPLDVNEGFMWGQTLQWGYYKHPPLQAWLLEATYHIFHTHPFGYFLLAQLTILTAMLGVYYSARLLTDPTRACLATLALSMIYYFNVTSLEFNPNTLQLATWAWVGYFFIRSLQTNHWRDWLGLGILLALAAYTKYFSVLLGLTLVLFFFLNRAARKHLTTAKPYVALTVCILLLVPHLMWLIQHDFLPFRYALGRGASSESSFITNHLLSPLNFSLAQAGAFLFVGIGLMLLPLKRSPLSLTPLFTLAWLPLMLSLLIGLMTGMHLRSMWGTPLLSFIPLYLLHYHTSDLSPTTLKRFIRLILAVNVLFISVVISAQLSGKVFSRMNFKGEALSLAWQNVWKNQTAPYTIIGSHWLAGNASFHSTQRPLVFIDGDLKKSPWINLENLKQQGAIVISESTALAKALQDQYQLTTQWQEPLTIQNQTYYLGIIQSN